MTLRGFEVSLGKDLVKPPHTYFSTHATNTNLA